jgi:hypothetical protein
MVQCKEWIFRKTSKDEGNGKQELKLNPNDSRGILRTYVFQINLKLLFNNMYLVNYISIKTIKIA